MRKSTFIVAFCISLMLMASCKKHIAPTITHFQGEGYLTENAQIYANDEVVIGFVATGEALTKLEATITQNGTFIASYPIYIEETDSYTGVFRISLDVAGTVTITGTVTDAAGQTASTSFNVICNEKPNARFLGHYEGNAIATGSMQAEIMGMEPFQDEFSDREVPVILDITAGEGLYEVIGTCTMDDRTLTGKGTVEGNVVTFEAVNDTFTFNFDPGNGFNLSPELNMSYTIKGTLTTDGKLAIDGSCQGEGNIMMLGTIKIDATFVGSLNKTTH